MTDIRIVPFRPEHAEAWRTLNEAWIRRDFELEPKDRKVLDDPVGEVIGRGGWIFVAEAADGPAVGCCALSPMGDGGLELAKMVVDEAARGQGLGRRLIEACIAQARACGAPRLYLETNSTLGPALALYRSAGFVDLPRQPTPYARCDVWMELRLAPTPSTGPDA